MAIDGNPPSAFNQIKKHLQNELLLNFMVKKLILQSQWNNFIFSILIPLLAFAIVIFRDSIDSFVLTFAAVAFVFITVSSAVQHAEVVAARIGEPIGSLVLVLAVTSIDVSIIIAIMLNGGSGVAELARDAAFAGLMIILTGMTGLTLLIGGMKFKEPEFNSPGVSSALTVIVAISFLTLILPNYTTTVAGPYYSDRQLIFVAIVSLILYGSFLFTQNYKHKAHYLTMTDDITSTVRPSFKSFVSSALLLALNLIAVVMLSDSLAPDLDQLINYLDAPVALSGIIIACVVLLPEGISAVRAANKNQMQRSLNISLGSAIASIGLTIPVVAIFAIFTKTPLALGLDSGSTVLFLAALFVIILSLSKGKTTSLQGIVLLTVFAVYLFITIFP